jgi:hypothetical protein
MNIMIADVLKLVLEPVDTTEHILLVHVVILDLQVVELAFAIPLIAAAKYVMIVAANAAAQLVHQHQHHQHAQLVRMAFFVVVCVFASRAHADVSHEIVSVKSMDI